MNQLRKNSSERSNRNHKKFIQYFTSVYTAVLLLTYMLCCFNNKSRKVYKIVRKISLCKFVKISNSLSVSF